jgi:hypothetical protein
MAATPSLTTLIVNNEKESRGKSKINSKKDMYSGLMKKCRL